jgi:hypothetical protein
VRQRTRVSQRLHIQHRDPHPGLCQQQDDLLPDAIAPARHDGDFLRPVKLILDGIVQRPLVQDAVHDPHEPKVQQEFQALEEHGVVAGEGLALEGVVRGEEEGACQGGVEGCLLDERADYVCVEA